MANEESLVNLDEITLQDCMDMFLFKGRETVLNDGKVTDIVFPEFKERARY